MTFIQPNKHSNIFNILLFGLTAAVLAAVMSLIMVYNDTVDFAHAATVARSEQKALETQNSELKRAVFVSFDPVAMAAFAAERGMVSDRKPDYFSLTKEWVVASHY